MRIDDELTSFEYAKQLKEAGFPQGESPFVWYMLQGDYGEKPHLRFHRGSRKHEYFDAPSVAQFSKIMPNHVSVEYGNDGWSCIYWRGDRMREKGSIDYIYVFVPMICSALFIIFVLYFFITDWIKKDKREKPFKRVEKIAAKKLGKLDKEA